MDLSRLATEALQALANEFGGVDLQYREAGWNQNEGPNKFRASLIPSANQDEAFRLTAFGYTALEAMAALSGMVTLVKRAKAQAHEDMKDALDAYGIKLVGSSKHLGTGFQQ